MTESTLDYPIVTPHGVSPVIQRAHIIQVMALEYFKHLMRSTEDFNLDKAFEVAQATWETEWPDDPEPRSVEQALEVMRAELAYWCEDSQ